MNWDHGLGSICNGKNKGVDTAIDNLDMFMTVYDLINAKRVKAVCVNNSSVIGAKVQTILFGNPQNQNNFQPRTVSLSNQRLRASPLTSSVVHQQA